MRYNISPPTTPTTKTSGSGGGNNSTNEVLLASLKLPVQMINTSAIQVDVHTTTASPLNLSTGLTSDLSDIPYIEDETNNGYRSSSITSITPQSQPQPQQQQQQQPIAQSKSLSAMTKKSSGFPLTKLKSQFKPAQLTLSAVPIDQGTKDGDKQTHSAGSGAGSGGGSSAKPSTTIDTKPHHSVPMMTGT